MKLDFKRVAVGVLAVTAAIVVGGRGSDDTSSDADRPEEAITAFIDASNADDATPPAPR